MVYIYIDLDMHSDYKYMNVETIPIIINGWNSQGGINLLYGAVMMILVVSQILTIFKFYLWLLVCLTNCHAVWNTLILTTVIMVPDYI